MENRVVRIPIDKDKIAEFCKRRRISRFAFFGSVLRDDFGPDSDVDVLVEFEPGLGITFANRVEMLDELSAMFGRETDLVDKRYLNNPYRRYEIVSSAETVYASQ
ncbi:MAG: nucleotidyltransferase domain-containing protein [Nitrospinae bacterium]|nr:nucleotidyltransferase domain-containing protein [Nitrospinota bacterium]MBF0633688.1 nucleotidyltransferase domain-containing protein [Nitrospinota bacterium]